MKLGEIYNLAIETGIDGDPRGREGAEKVLAKRKAHYDKLDEKEKEYFDMESLSNPYLDSRVHFGDPEKEIKKIMQLIEKQWNAKLKLGYAFLKTEKGKIYIVNEDISKLDLSKLRINSIGLYFGELRGDELRLSIEGSQIIGKNASKNVIVIHLRQ